ncbi:Cell wall protein ECM33 [Zancudomyces culisetae]|uniref:Cell wall protein ECM33 n=1 Tax=Zancudomyces culisetae TaxID=1213189 RepID=A0A1R1PR65_ZANCU|nr:Cell wall protein ECM33 [Zancudomyces culisetae]|eukprot:OMH83457.1 Cell wall protein ECM33 [Zancudomyces culisetae]
MNSVRIAQVGIAEFGIPKIVQLDYLDIENNDGLRKIEIPRLKKVNSYVKISNNNALSTATFNSLNEIDGNVTFSGLSAISAPKLGGIADSLVFLENTFESLALEKLQVVGKELQLIRNDNMKAFAFPSLKKIGGATIIQNNTEMTAIDENCFPSLQQLIGKMLLIGPLEYIAIPALKSTSIPVTITSSGNLDCFETKKRHEIKGRDKWVCSSLKSKKDKGEPKEVDFNKLVDSSSNPLKLFGNIGFFIAILFFTILTILL